MSKEQEPRRHHLVPKVHLRRFARDDRLYVVDLQEQNTFVTSVDNVAAEVGFYDIDVADLGRTDVEKALGEIEGGFGRVMQQIDAGNWPLPAEDRRMLATFVSFQHIRGRRFRDSLSSFFDELGRKVLLLMANKPHLLERALKEKGIELTGVQLADLVESIQTGGFQVDIDQTSHVAVMVKNAVELVDLYEAFSWVLLEASDSQVELLTGDHPVVLWTEQPGLAPFYGVGIGTADQITLPIDQNRALMLLPEDRGDRKEELAPELSATLNGRLVRSVRRFVFANPDGLGAQIDQNVAGQRRGDVSEESS